MAELESLECGPSFAGIPVDGIISLDPEAMEDVEDFPRHEVIRADLAQDIGKGVARVRLNATPFGDYAGQALRELARLDQRCIGIVDEVPLRVTCQDLQRWVDLSEMPEVAT